MFLRNEDRFFTRLYYVELCIFTILMQNWKKICEDICWWIAIGHRPMIYTRDFIPLICKDKKIKMIKI